MKCSRTKLIKSLSENFVMVFLEINQAWERGISFRRKPKQQSILSSHAKSRPWTKDAKNQLNKKYIQPVWRKDTDKPTNPVKDLKGYQAEWRYIACSFGEDSYCKGVSFLQIHCKCNADAPPFFFWHDNIILIYLEN